jgi:pimeloyl-ACP methyl ester carboxylesterase
MAAADPVVRLYSNRGFAGVAFSRGMNNQCEEVARMPQVICTVEEHYRAADIEPQAVQAIASGQKLVLVGHSWGAHAALNIAAAIKGSVSLLVTIDPNWFPTPPRVPANVEIALNYYQDVDVLGRAVLQPSPAFRGQFQQFRRGESHVMIDRSPEIHAEILARIRSLLASQTTQQRRIPDTNRRKR